MKMRNKRKQFWWTFRAKEEILSYMGLFIHKELHFGWGVGRIKHQQKDKIK
jgi:hypothetical protein